jgi:hypothetical protein
LFSIVWFIIGTGSAEKINDLIVRTERFGKTFITRSQSIYFRQTTKLDPCSAFDLSNRSLVGFVLAEDEFFVLQE